ncbi:hypothetical protein O1V64_11185 [Rouxiella badensis]|nr:hypothetical protein O1V64_11185 [Rouxiella badensis]
MESNKDLYSITENHLYSDSSFTNTVNGGDAYSFINMLSQFHSPNIVSSAITVRAKWFVSMNELEHVGRESHSDDFHGGWFNDEIAALSSLKLGVRFHAGDFIRTFNHNNAEFGDIIAEGSPPPNISFKRNAPIVPNAIKDIDCSSLQEINNIGKMSEGNYSSLIKAARTYQNALWICETNPNLAWLLLVSSLETAAQQWHKSKTTEIETLEESKPELFNLLNTEDYKSLIPNIAESISPYLGATRKFRNFCLNFLPSEPENRPGEEIFRICWKKQSLREIFNTVYNHRSKALHGGLPFPDPMCKAPNMGGHFSEICVTSLLTTLGGTWSSKDAPVTLNTFNHMTHSILNQWWSTLYES